MGLGTRRHAGTGVTKKLLASLLVLSPVAHAGSLEELNERAWIHGSADCSTNQDAALDVYQFDEATYVLRQNICVHYEAPFIYVLFGEHSVFVQDTGATAEPDRFPLYATVQTLIERRQASHPSGELKLIVAHSHSHGDHTAADAQFRGRPRVTLVEPTPESVRAYFGFDRWPDGTATLDLGGRELTVIPSPGHHDEAIVVYDSATRWLLTGDNLYPGRLYIKDWGVYKHSIRRLSEFAKTREVSAVMGSHIEMSRVPGETYAPGSTHHPDEAGLTLSVNELASLDSLLEELGDDPQHRVTANYVIRPLNAVEQFLSWALRKLGF